MDDTAEHSTARTVGTEFDSEEHGQGQKNRVSGDLLRDERVCKKHGTLGCGGNARFRQSHLRPAREGGMRRFVLVARKGPDSEGCRGLTAGGNENGMNLGASELGKEYREAEMNGSFDRNDERLCLGVSRKAGRIRETCDRLWNCRAGQKAALRCTYSPCTVLGTRDPRNDKTCTRATGKRQGALKTDDTLRHVSDEELLPGPWKLPMGSGRIMKRHHRTTGADRFVANQILIYRGTFV